MTMPSIKSLAILLAFATSAPAQSATLQQPAADRMVKGASPTGSSAPPAVDASSAADLSQELKAIQGALPGKKKELARLRHKWAVAKGRTPTKEEVLQFQERLAKGEASEEDNPFLNKNPLSTQGPARLAYYKKLQEIQKDEERVRRLENHVESLKMGVNPATAPVERRQ